MFAKKLKELRKRRNYTQQQLAEKLGISTSAVGMYEQGRREPDSELLKRIAESFSVSVDELLSERAGSDVMELDEAIDRVVNKLLAERTLSLNGEILGAQDLQQIANAIRVGVEIVAKGIRNEENKQ